ncbi:hypothetical protein [Streptomyces sp. NRRL F-2664]|uniref:hypothetical protein n=1 Tax=Streptomyces sp. NRRL F-2664 TaxID=1463842 RepID=UPI001F47EB7F|nr:hypothetical protein [Streptomyces sp. NRRL F-2664]
MITHLDARAPPPARALRQARPGYVLVDGTPAEGARVGSGQDGYAGKRRTHGANIWAPTGPPVGSSAVRRDGPRTPRPPAPAGSPPSVSG